VQRCRCLSFWSSTLSSVVLFLAQVDDLHFRDCIALIARLKLVDTDDFVWQSYLKV
jgi:hypothetical protein